ncbi:MAG: hypothetical protein LC107_01725 [Chitinophagales bacterium]|nr:hypothetical protein [Chitinophagales bacterium]
MALNDKIFNIPEAVLGKDYTIVGEGKKGLVMVVSRQQYDESAANLLSNMMKAIQYDMQQDVLIVIQENENPLILSHIIPSWSDLILFGVTPAMIGFQINPRLYHVVLMEKGQLLCADNLQVLNASLDKKKAIWTLFQNMFLKK